MKPPICASCVKQDVCWIKRMRGDLYPIYECDVFLPVNFNKKYAALIPNK